MRAVAMKTTGVNKQALYIAHLCRHVPSDWLLSVSCPPATPGQGHGDCISQSPCPPSVRPYSVVMFTNGSMPNGVPYALRIKGSVLKRIWPQVLLITCVSVVITGFGRLATHHVDFGIQPTMISTLGFVVGLALSFRTTTAYTNWKEARVAWEKLNSLSRNLARLIWLHCPPGSTSAELLRRKSAVNLVGYFAVALKHHLREERGHAAADVADLIPHLHTFSKIRVQQESDLALAASHPCYETHPKDVTANYTCQHGTLPTEITWHLGAFLEHLVNKQKMLPVAYSQGIAMLNGFSEVTSTCERILRSPTPPAYDIVISQLVWLFLIFLPFQLLKSLGWVSIPVTFITSAMIMGLAEIGLEIQNPWVCLSARLLSLIVRETTRMIWTLIAWHRLLFSSCRH
jgi:predicted membrane chloride channel (bestrophin family)